MNEGQPSARETLSLSPSQLPLPVWRFTSLMLTDARLEQAELLLTCALKVERLL
jgi:hypothetical protein